MTRVAILGAGVQARSHVEVVGALLPEAELLVYDLHSERAESIATDARAAGLHATVVADARAAAHSAQVVITVATLGAASQVMTPDWLSAGTLVVAVDFATYASAALARKVGHFVVDDRAQFLAYRESGYFDGYPDPGATMGELLDAGPDGRPTTTGRAGVTDGSSALVTHLGVGLADVIFADAIARRAEQAGVGVELAR